MDEKIASAVYLPLPALDPLVGPWRRRFDPSGTQGVPPHITLLYPFLPPAELDDSVVDALRALFGELGGPGRIRFEQVALSGGLVHLAPAQDGWFRAATQAIVRRWPQCPPYRGKHGDPLPHVTIGYGDPPPPFQEIAGAIEPALPLILPAPEAHLAVLGGGIWTLRARLPLS